MPVLALDDVHSFYGNVHALKGVSLEVRPGELVSLIGANGAGKSSTLRTISGLLAPRAGRVRFEGADITGERPASIVRRGIAHCPEERKIWPAMTVREHLELGACTRRDRDGIAADVARVLRYFPRLRERQRQLAGTLSGGEQQMLAIARALMARPKLLMLDEPSLGLSPILVDQITAIIREIHAAATTVLLVEQNAFLALSLSQRCYVMETGRITVSGRSEELMENPFVRRAYLGG
jgi:branched-chain amino acid transport system ATP-binding protein